MRKVLGDKIELLDQTSLDYFKIVPLCEAIRFLFLLWLSLIIIITDLVVGSKKALEVGWAGLGEPRRPRGRRRRPRQ